MLLPKVLAFGDRPLLPLQSQGLCVPGEPVKIWTMKAGEALEVGKRPCLLKCLGVDCQGHRAAVDSGTATGRLLRNGPVVLNGGMPVWKVQIQEQ